jgi:hypothetical protein
MFKKLNVLLLIFGIVSAFASVPAKAIENGTDDLNNKRLVSIYRGLYSETAVLFCSGFLFSADIVFSAGHCFNSPGSGSYDLFVSEPGVKASQINKKIKVVEHFSPSDMDDLNFNNDFAILILEKPISTVTQAKIISLDKLKDLISNNSIIKISGYGLQSNACFEYAPTCVGVTGLDSKRSRLDMPRTPKTINAKLTPENRLKNKVNIFKPNGLEVYAQYSEGTSICGGDSGGPNTVFLDNEEFYIGASSSTSSANACGMGAELSGGGYSTFYPAANYLDLISESINAAKSWRDLAKKTPSSILCIKGNIEKVVISKTPKCASGYKQTTLENAKPMESKLCPEIGKISGSLTCVASEGKKVWFKLTIEQSFNGHATIGSQCYRDGVITMGYNNDKEYVTIICSFREAGAFPKWLDL